MTALGDEREDEYGREGQDEGPGDDETWQEAEAEAFDLDEDEPLPWLESSDYEEDDGVSIGRIVGFALLALAVLGVLVGGFAYLTNKGTDPELVADGSTIAAPEGAIKERPADPGGKEFEGTGDVAPAVGEGQVREGRIADGAEGNPAARPSVAAPTTDAAASSVATGGAYVQVAAVASKAGADQRWREISGRTDALNGFKYRVQEAKIDNGTVYRLQAVAADKAAAQRLCNALKADGIECIVK
jgi:hypothetical protein